MSKETSTLPTRALGTTGMAITRVGFGAWAIGGGGWAFAWGSQDDEASIAAMRHAVERGVNWIDTAAVYGLGHSEELVGRLLRDYPARDRPVRLHQVRPGVERAGSPGSGAADRRTGFAAARGRAVAHAARRRTDRPLSDALAGGRRHARRGLLADAARSEEGGQGPRGRPVESQGRSAGGRRTARARRHAAAAVLPDPPRRARPPSSRGASRTTPA